MSFAVGTRVVVSEEPTLEGSDVVYSRLAGLEGVIKGPEDEDGDYLVGLDNGDVYFLGKSSLTEVKPEPKPETLKQTLESLLAEAEQVLSVADAEAEAAKERSTTAWDRVDEIKWAIDKLYRTPRVWEWPGDVPTGEGVVVTDRYGIEFTPDHDHVAYCLYPVSGGYLYPRKPFTEGIK